MPEESKLVSKLAVEFFGAFLLSFTCVCNVINGNQFAAFSIAFALVLGVYIGAPISGGHVNPAATTTVALSGNMCWKLAPAYIGVQLLAGLLAGLLGGYLAESSSVENNLDFKGLHFAKDGGPGPFPLGLGGIVECSYTMLLCFSVLSCACAKAVAGNQYFGITIGFSVVCGGFAAGKTAWAAMNPAVAFALFIASDVMGKGSGSIGTLFAYWAFEILGAILAVFFYRIIFPNEVTTENVGHAICSKIPTLVSKLLAEALGMYWFMLTLCLNVKNGNMHAAFSIGTSLMCTINCMCSVSGGHLNPGVTTALVATRRNCITIKDALCYVAAQIFGCFIAAMCAKAVYSYASVAYVNGSIGGVNAEGIPVPGDGLMLVLMGKSDIIGKCIIVEILFMGLLAYTVLCVATVRDNSHVKDYFGMLIGGTVWVGGFALGHISGGFFNPGLTIGTQLYQYVVGIQLGDSNGYAGWIYVAAQLVGALGAAALFRLTHEVEYRDGSYRILEPPRKKE